MDSIGWSLIGLLLFSLLGCEGAPDGEQGAGETRIQAIQAPGPKAIRANNRGVGLMGRFDYGAAAEVFAGLAAEYPDWRDAKLNLAIAILNRQKEGDEKEALALVDEVLAVDSKHLRAHYVAGLLRLYLSSSLEAMGHFAEVAEGDPKDAYAAYYLGQCLAQQSEPEKALVEYRRALALDPYLRSAAYGAFQALQRLRRRDEARAFIDRYQRLGANPRARLAEFKYTRMGPKAEALAVGVVTERQYAPRPKGPVFTDLAPLTEAEFLPVLSEYSSEYLGKRAGKDARSISMTVVDLEQDGNPNLFVAGVSGEKGQHNLLLTATQTGEFAARYDTPLTRVPDVNGALWGDFDNDGHTDVYLCRRGENQLWRNDGEGGWIDVTVASGVGNGALDTMDGAFFDADHDGDLDLFLVNVDGPNELLHNNLNGTFRAGGLKGTNGKDGKGNSAPLLVIPADLDRDRDADIIVLNRAPPHRVYVNDRLWAYHSSPDFSDFEAAPALSATVGDSDRDGWPEIYTLTPDGVMVWARNGEGKFTPRVLSRAPWADETFSGPAPFAGGGANGDVKDDAKDMITSDSPWRMAMMDADGDGILDLLMGSRRGWSVVRLARRADESKEKVAGTLMAEPLFTAMIPEGKRLLGMTPMLQRPGAGHGLVGLMGTTTDGGVERGVELLHWTPGRGRYPFLALAFSGREEVGKSMRSNASGIGTRVAARVGARWTIVENFRDHSGPGQNLQPIPIGLGGASGVDFVAVDWSDGVFQTELDLDPGQLHRITETQRQLSSCPVLFAWDGEKYRFVTDFLGVGGMGYALGPPGEYGIPRPWENLLLAEGVSPKQGRYVFKLTEPMEETAYLDALGLTVHDLPPGWRMVLDERMNIEGPEPTGAAIFFRREFLPERAVNERGETVTAFVASADGRAALVGALDRRFIGRLAGEHVLTLVFPEEIRGSSEIPGASPHGSADRRTTDRLGIDGKTPVLIIDGWVEYPYSQTAFAAWQAGANWEAPTVEALGEDGAWYPILTRFGYPAGMPRTMSAPLRGLPPGARTIRLRTNQEIYWDRIAVAFPESPPKIHKYPLSLAGARLAAVGFPKRADGPQRYPRFDYDRRRPFWDTRPMSGSYTEYGPVDELLSQVDDALAIFGAGEEIHVEFTAPAEPPPPGWRRYLVLETHGWTKDRDLYTRNGETVAPLPEGGRSSERRDALHARYNTRYVGDYFRR
uniref:Repeat domain-containing protein n=1 Tax=Candidatus Kentrum sp. SD TaxID=2126332 RepID=A0A450Y9S4_9GAMM|nr:MAG: Repeat domain-containing protein [Candidatus Kentron sp. SD]VFK44319.1 MAG: Repeat domain-containing protein [Candidatus Kentron sp. SD]